MSASGGIRFVQCVSLQLLLLIMRRECGPLPNCISGYDSIDASLTDPLIDESKPAYPCLSALKIDFRDNSTLLVGACSDPTLELSSEIGTLSVNKLDQPIEAIFGNITKPCRDRKQHYNYIDGEGRRAQIITAEYLVQGKDNPNILYFVDGQSCIRQAELDTGSVKTIIGARNCGNGTLDMLPSERGFKGRLVRGMEYYEKRDLFFVSIIEHGLWMYYKSGNSWIRKELIAFADISGGPVNDIIKQLTLQDDTLWQRVSNGINAYNLTGLTSGGRGELHCQGEPDDCRFLSSSGSDNHDPTARHKITDPNLELGDGDAQLSFSPDKDILMIADTLQDRLFFMDSLTGKLTVFCKKANEHFQDAKDPENCTFNTLSASMWLDKRKVLIFDANRNGDEPAFRIFKLERSSTTPSMTTLGPKTISNTDNYGKIIKGIILFVIFIAAILITITIMVQCGCCCFKPYKGAVSRFITTIINFIMNACCTKKSPPTANPPDQGSKGNTSSADALLPTGEGSNSPVWPSTLITKVDEKNNTPNPTSEPRGMNRPTGDTTYSTKSSDELVLPTLCTKELDPVK